MIIEAKGLTKKFGTPETEVVAVNQVNISIHMGELVMFMGDSGCGKTTLISLLGCILTPDEGELSINQKLVDYENGDLPIIRRRDVGFVFQLFNLIPYLTALENVALGLEHRLNHRPGQLSGGEKQRVSFARALANQPKIIFADEPTANLDSRQSQNLMALVQELRQDDQTTIAIVTHHQELRKNADRIIHMKDGKII